MNSHSPSSASAHQRRFFARSCMIIGLFLTPLLGISAAEVAKEPPAKVEKVKGSATNTITSLVFLDETTIAIEAQQVGKLDHFGKFTGAFSYVATLTPDAIFIVGTATLTNDKGDKLFIDADIVEVGTDYPYKTAGALTVKDGTGKYEGAKGVIAITGKDKASLEDTFHLDGALSIVK